MTHINRRRETALHMSAGYLYPDHDQLGALLVAVDGRRSLFGNTEQSNPISAIYLFNARAYVGRHTTEDPAMFTRQSHDSFTTLVLASLVIAATVLIGSLSHAVASMQIVA
jgi:hypothetical protein